jgi:deoxyribonuclease-4
LINLASPNPKLYGGSIHAYIEDMQEAERLKADYIVTHMGSHKKTGEKAGIKRITRALNIIFRETKGLKVVLLLENTSGSGSWLGYKFAHTQKIINNIQEKSRIGVCFDTCHAYTAGFDLSSPEGYSKTIENIDRIVGLKRLKLVHLNDSRDGLGSHADRHEHIGKGSLGPEAFRRIVNDPRLSSAAFILETPKDSENADKNNLKTVRKLIKK